MLTPQTTYIALLIVQALRLFSSPAGEAPHQFRGSNSGGRAVRSTGLHFLHPCS